MDYGECSGTPQDTCDFRLNDRSSKYSGLKRSVVTSRERRIRERSRLVSGRWDFFERARTRRARWSRGSSERSRDRCQIIGETAGNSRPSILECGTTRHANRYWWTRANSRGRVVFEGLCSYSGIHPERRASSGSIDRIRDPCPRGVLCPRSGEMPERSLSFKTRAFRESVAADDGGASVRRLIYAIIPTKYAPLRVPSRASFLLHAQERKRRAFARVVSLPAAAKRYGGQKPTRKIRTPISPKI